MAVDDVINDTANIAAAGTADFQPASGVEVVLIGISCSNTTAADDSTFALFDGTVPSEFFQNFSAATGFERWIGGKMGLTNTNFLRQQNNAAATKSFGFSGIQTK